MILTLTLLLSIIPRLISLDHLPLALSNDEISIAYDAFSLLRSGRDQHATAFPLSFASLGTVKAPAYSYFLTPFLLFLPNTDFTARLPSVVAGLLTILTVFLITSKITSQRKTGLISALTLSLSPWHFLTSRMVLEANLALLFLALGICIFLYAKKPLHLVISSLFLSLSLYSYHSEWLLVPLLILGIVILYFKRWGKSIAIVPLSLLLFCLPLIIDYHLQSSTNLSLQSHTQMLFSSPTATLLPTLSQFLRNYFSYQNPGYLFFTGLSLYPENHPFESGLFPAIFIIPFLIGLFLLITKKISHQKFLIYWLIASPIVSALTTGSPNSRRDLISILPYSVVIALGFTAIIKNSQAYVFTTLLTVTSYLMFIGLYFTAYPRLVAASFPPYRPLSSYLKTLDTCHHSTVIDFRYGISHELTGVPHLYLAYYQKLSPEILQYHLDKSGGLLFSHYQITRIDWDRFIIKPGYIYVVPFANSPPPSSRSQLQLLHTISDTAGAPSLEIWSSICQ